MACPPWPGFLAPNIHSSSPSQPILTNANQVIIFSVPFPVPFIYP